MGIASPGPTKPWQPLELHTSNASSPKGAQKGAHIHRLLSSSPQPWRSERGDPLTEKKPGPREGLDRAETGTWESPCYAVRPFLGHCLSRGKTQNLDWGQGLYTGTVQSHGRTV